MTTQPIDMLLVGHITADIVEDGRVLGGTPSYVAATAHAMGVRLGAVTSAISDDPLLDEFRQYTEVHCIPAQETTTFQNIYEPTGRKQYVRGIAAPIKYGDVPAVWRDTSLVVISPMAGEVDPALVHEFKQARTLITLQGWLRRWDEDGLVHFKRWFDPEVIKAVDIIVFSEEDIREAPELEQEIAAIANNLIVTRAEKGGTHYYPGGRYEYNAIDVKVVHPTGAGDVFAGALLVALDKLGGDMKTALKIASQFGGYSVTRHGLNGAPTPAEIEQIMGQYEVK